MTPEQQAWVKAKQERGLSEARLQALARKLPCELRGASLDNYEITNHEAHLPIFKTVTKYCENIKDNLAKGIGLFLMGSCGTGKDHLVFCAAQAAIEAGAEVYFIHGVTEHFHLVNASRDDVESSYEFAVRDYLGQRYRRKRNSVESSRGKFLDSGDQHSHEQRSCYFCHDEHGKHSGMLRDHHRTALRSASH